MPAQTQITTNTTVKSFLGITASTDDALLSLMCDWLTAFIESYCSKKFVQQTITDELYNSKDFKFSLYLDNSPASSITTFKKKQSDGTWKDLVEGTDYDANLSIGLIRLFEIDNGIGDLKITYVVGGTIPKDLEMVATQLVARVYSKRKSEGITQENMGEASIQWGALLNDSDKAILNNHRRFTSIIA